MEMGEQIAVGGLADEMEIECPFKDEGPLDVSTESEDVANDDLASDEQANDGGVLGRNLASGGQGKAGTVAGPYPPPENPAPVPRVDTPRAQVRVFVPGADGIEDGELPFIVAAHHLIPGEASLGPSLLKQQLMTEGGSVEIAGKQRQIKNHIGYNVNGAHNGVWLPGNYAIRANAAPLRKTWSNLGDKPGWCMSYVAAVSSKAGGQFHDAHTQYSDSVKRLLNKIHQTVSVHECTLCQEKTEVPPPYMVKNRLYALSLYLRSQLQGPPSTWRRPWFASDRWRDAVFSGQDQRETFERIFRTSSRH